MFHTKNSERPFAGRTARKKTRAALTVAALAVGTLTLPAVMASPAQAATTAHGCTVKPHRPVVVGLTSLGKKIIDYRISVECSGNRWIQVQRQRWEWDGGIRIRKNLPFVDEDDWQGETSEWRWFSPSSQKKLIVLTNTRALVKTDSDVHEDPYQVVRYRVVSNGVTSGWTTWEAGPYSSIPY